MQTILFDSYRNYQKKNKDTLIKTIIKLPIIAKILLAAIAGCLLFSILTLFWSYLRKLYFVCLIVEVFTCIALYFYTENYQIKTSDIRLSIYQSYCEKIYNWLDQLGIITTENNIRELKSRIDADIRVEEEKRNLRRDRIDRWIQILIIPILLAVFSATIKEKQDVTVIITYALTLLIFSGSLGLAFLNCYNIFDFFRKRKLVQLRSFADDLQGVLDTQFEKRFIKAADPTEDQDVTSED